VYSTSWCPDCHRALGVLEKAGVEFAEIDVDFDSEGLEIVKQHNKGKRIVPTILFPDGSVLIEPSNGELRAKLSKL
jgi:mycoredoxin